MDQNEITMAMDVKMDLKEKKSEYFQLRTWTKCIVKIEAIKYIPCFIKITLIPNGREEKSNVVIKINIPGLAVQLAASRSKDYSYGLFWTQHRKNCCIFFALDSKVNLERHIKWVQNSINNLELHRREMLEFRRNSRISKIDESTSRPSDVVVLPMNETQDMKDINDILGPLPNVPDSSINWSRRISGVSEIYEEIIEGDTSNRNLSRKFSRTSIASGIYEVMTYPLDIITESNPVIEEIPPPLPPPRPRVNTQSEISRTYTNPESISSKKRKRNIFESVFLRHKTMQKQKSPKPKDLSSKPESPAIELIRSHRMSYSSPDLSKVEINHYENEFESDLMARSSATEFSFRNEHSFLNSTASSTGEKPQIDADGNISDNILSTFNISCNESTVNLVGKNLNGTAASPKVATIIDEESGYCRMAPIFRNNSNNSPLPIEELPFMPLPVASRMDQSPNRIDLTKTITFRRNYGLESSIENFENLTISKDSNSSSINDALKESDVCKNNKSSSLTKKSSGLESISTLPVDIAKRNVYNQSFDEKYPSYHPNDVQKVTPKDPRKENGIVHVSNMENSPYRAENLYIATPRHRMNRKTMPNRPLNSQLNTFQVFSPSKASFLLNPSTPSNQSISVIPPKNISSASPLLYQKYGTAVTPMNVTDNSSCKKSSDLTNSIKRFATLPRFRKIDFSPLKLKINSVLQRQNPDQM